MVMVVYEYFFTALDVLLFSSLGVACELIFRAPVTVDQ